MTFAAALAQAAVGLDVGLDVVIERAHERFEESLVANHCPAELLEEMRDYERAHLAAWRERALSEIRERLLWESRTAETVH